MNESLEPFANKLASARCVTIQIPHLIPRPNINISAIAFAISVAFFVLSRLSMETLNFLTEHKIEQYADLTAKISEIAAASEQAADSLKAAEKRLADMAVLIKNVTTYQKTKPAYDAYRKAKNKDRYRTDHERAIILHEAAAKALQTAGIKKLPNLAALQAEYEQLQAQKEALYADYGKLKKQAKEYDVVKRNIDSILRQDKEPEREKETERG